MRALCRSTSTPSAASRPAMCAPSDSRATSRWRSPAWARATRFPGNGHPASTHSAMVQVADDRAAPRVVTSTRDRFASRHGGSNRDVPEIGRSGRVPTRGSAAASPWRTVCTGAVPPRHVPENATATPRTPVNGLEKNNRRGHGRERPSQGPSVRCSGALPSRTSPTVRIASGAAAAVRPQQGPARCTAARGADTDGGLAVRTGQGALRGLHARWPPLAGPREYGPGPGSVRREVRAAGGTPPRRGQSGAVWARGGASCVRGAPRSRSSTWTGCPVRIDSFAAMPTATARTPSR